MVRAGALRIHVAQQDPMFSAESRAKRVKQWLEEVQTDQWFVDPLTDRDSTMLKLEPEECVSLSMRRGTYGSIGYEQVTRQRIPAKDYHTVHRGFRNEWWTIHGVLSGNIHVTFRIHRHSEIPDATKATSLVRITFDSGGGDVYDTNYHPEATEFVSLDTNLRVSCGRNSIYGRDSEHMFPLEMNWEQLHLTLDKTKPMVMFQSNGSVPGAPGIKYYMYPSIRGSGKFRGSPVTFSGMYEHWWESAAVPPGCSESAVGRSLELISRDIMIVEPQPWIHVFMHHEGVELSAYVPLRQRVLKKCVCEFLRVDENGHTSRASSAVFEPQMWSPNQIIVLANVGDKTYKLTLAPRRTEWTGTVRLLNHDGGTDAWCIMQTMPGHELVFDESTDVTDIHANSESQNSVANLDSQDRAEESNVNSASTTMAWLVWVIPLIVFSILLVACVSIMYIKRRSKPWTKPYKSLFG